MPSESARDTLYMWFLALHAPITILVDLQALFFAERCSPSALRQICEASRRQAKGDPLLTNANAPGWAWFQSFIILEAVFQLPVFVLGAHGLSRGNKRIWPLLAIYGASSATTTFACLATVLSMPDYRSELPKLLASYVPFLLVPLAMAVDFGSRLTTLAGRLESSARRHKLE